MLNCQKPFVKKTEKKSGILFQVFLDFLGFQNLFSVFFPLSKGIVMRLLHIVVQEKLTKKPEHCQGRASPRLIHPVKAKPPHGGCSRAYGRASL